MVLVSDGRSRRRSANRCAVRLLLLRRSEAESFIVPRGDLCSPGIVAVASARCAITLFDSGRADFSVTTPHYSPHCRRQRASPVVVAAVLAVRSVIAAVATAVIIVSSRAVFGALGRKGSLESSFSCGTICPFFFSCEPTVSCTLLRFVFKRLAWPHRDCGTACFFAHRPVGPSWLAEYIVSSVARVPSPFLCVCPGKSGRVFKVA